MALDEATRDMIRAHAQRIADKAPPLTTEQKDYLRALLRPVPAPAPRTQASVDAA
ncbi:hypothetical protein [Streptomyces sp. NPDC101115]|uniref:hypothetical protein n=1 Tax=Streptomyces sp. NPDC101115 TaxID=3366106 RepID=UPI003823E8AB